MFFIKLDFDLIIVQNAQFSSKEAQLRSIEAQLLFSYSQKSLRFPQKTLIHSQERFKVRVFASNGFAMLACWSFPLRTKRLQRGGKYKQRSFIRPTFTVSLFILRRGSFVFRRCLFDSNGFAMLASLLISLGRKRLKLDPKYKPLRFSRPRLTVSML